jgi:hypothetical protein
MWVSGHDPLNARCPDRFRVVLSELHEECLFTKATHLVSTVLLGRSEYDELLANVLQDPRRRAPNRLHSIVIGSYAVYEKQCAGANVAIGDFHFAT